MAIRLEANLSDIEGDMLLLAHADVNDPRPEMLFARTRVRLAPVR